MIKVTVILLACFCTICHAQIPTFWKVSQEKMLERFMSYVKIIDREGKEGYVHCYFLSHPLDEFGKPNVNDYVVKVRLRYFDQEEGAYQKKLMEDNLKEVQAAFPFVEVRKTDDQFP